MSGAMPEGPHGGEIGYQPGDEVEELLLIEEADAWFEYLEATRAQSEARYREIEPWAWARLAQRTCAIEARRAKITPTVLGLDEGPAPDAA